MSNENDADLPQLTVEQAIDWYVQLNSGVADEQLQQAFRQWYEASAQHAQAWLRVHKIGQHFKKNVNNVPPTLVHSTLGLAQQKQKSRRIFIKTCIFLGVGIPGVYWLQSYFNWQRYAMLLVADISTGTGQQRDVILKDGTRLKLNTATAIDVDYEGDVRRVVLHTGEIMVTTGHDPKGRPFELKTPEGTLVPVGTQFSVLRDDSVSFLKPDTTRIIVTQGAVQISPRHKKGGIPLILKAGEQTSFTRDSVAPLSALDEQAQSWADGMITAEGMRLQDFIADLSRYRSGYLGCALEVADLRITGAWSLNAADATDRILASLARELPVDIKRTTNAWVKVVARKK